MTLMEAAAVWSITITAILGATAIATQAMLIHENQRRAAKAEKKK